jgi:TIR domain
MGETVVSSAQDSDGIFISYRREDTAAQAGRLYDHLRERFGEDLVFMDVEAIAIGTDFTKSLIDAVSGCHVLIVLIGRHWLTVTDSEGGRRIDNSDDWVRVEVEAALQRDILVVPVLVDGAALPLANDLPPSLQSLIRRQALELTHASFRPQVRVLMEAIEQVTVPGGRLKLLEHTDTKSRFRLWMGREAHEIIITLGMSGDEIYVDGKFVRQVTSLTARKSL